MDVKRTISISEARKRIFDIAEEVQAPHRVYTLTADGKPKAVIMSAEEYESWVETMEVLRDCPDILERSAEVDKAIRTGDWSKFTTLEQLEKEWGFVVAEKPTKKYVVSSRNRGKSKKGIK